MKYERPTTEYFEMRWESRGANQTGFISIMFKMYEDGQCERVMINKVKTSGVLIKFDSMLHIYQEYELHELSNAEAFLRYL